MVTRLSFALLAVLAVAAFACGGGGDKPAAGEGSARPAAAPTRPSGRPTAAVEPKSGPPGTQVTVTGTGWPAGVLVDVTAVLPPGVTAPPYATVTTDGSGSFIAQFRLEKRPDGADLQVGRFDLIARSAGVQLDVPFLVETRRPIFGPGPGG